jgi:transposase
MKQKIQYRAVNVDQLSLESLLSVFPEGSRVVVGVDVAKRKFLASLCNAAGEAQVIVRFEHPTQTMDFVGLVAGLHDANRPVELVMEPTGTYGDPLRYQMRVRSIPVFRVNNKHVHDAAELFDRSASKHDAKDACLIAWLHVNDRSTPWEPLPEERRTLRALVAQRELYDEPLRSIITHMEPILARHFPELEKLFDLGRRKTPFRLLEKYGSPKNIAAEDPEQLREFLKKAARKAPEPAFVKELINAAATTSGDPLIKCEIELIKRMSTEVLRLMTMRDGIDADIAKSIETVPSAQAMRPTLGAVTAAVIFAFLGAPEKYGSAAALEKAVGLNLIERSSGENSENCPKHISKRGPGIVRKYLYLASMRLVQNDPIAKAWYHERKSYQAENKLKALIAVERKLCRALFHVAAGNKFDARKLFDARRLGFESDVPEAA